MLGFDGLGCDGAAERQNDERNEPFVPVVVLLAVLAVLVERRRLGLRAGLELTDRIKNLSFAASQGGLEITFAATNHAQSAVDRVQEITLTLGGEPVTFVMSCQDYDLLLYPGLSSGVVTFELGDAGGQSSLVAGVYCPQTYGPSTLPWGGSLTIELKGLLADATPWTATASATR